MSTESDMWEPTSKKMSELFQRLDKSLLFNASRQSTKVNTHHTHHSC